MYVRWKRRLRDGREWYAAQVVASSRVGGKPRQRVVAYLGIISATAYPEDRQQFWRGVDERLSTDAVPEAERDQLAATVAASVPRLTADEEAAIERRYARLRQLERRIQAADAGM